MVASLCHIVFSPQKNAMRKDEENTKKTKEAMQNDENAKHAEGKDDILVWRKDEIAHEHAQ